MMPGRRGLFVCLFFGGGRGQEGVQFPSCPSLCVVFETSAYTPTLTCSGLAKLLNCSQEIHCWVILNPCYEIGVRGVCIDLTEQDVNLVVKEKGPQEQVEMRGRVFVTVSLADLLGSLGDPQRLGKLFLWLFFSSWITSAYANDISRAG